MWVISNTLPQGTVSLASINSTPSSAPATDHLLQPSLTPTPHFQKRKNKQEQARNPP